MNILYLPVELWFYIGDFLSPFDNINLNYALNLKIPIKNLGDYINKFSRSGKLQLMLYKIVTVERNINYNIINIIKDILYIIDLDEMYLTRYNFSLHTGEYCLSESSKYNFIIFFTNISLLKYYLVTYLHFVIVSDFNLIFTIKRNISFLPRGH